MTGFERFVEELVAVNVAGAPLLVAYANHFEVEGRGVSHLGADLAPWRTWRAVGKLDEVERVLNVLMNFFELGGLAGVELAGHAAVEDGERAGADGFRRLEGVVEAEAKGL